MCKILQLRKYAVAKKGQLHCCITFKLCLHSYNWTEKCKGMPSCLFALHGIKATRLKRKVLQFDTDIRDGRSKHDQHPKIDNKTMNKIRQRIKDVSCLKEPLQSFPRTLTKLTLMRLSMLQQCTKTFLHKNRDLNKKVKDWLYSKIFNTVFNISFGYS